MANENQNNQTQDTQVVLNVVTDEKLEQALTEQWASFKTWVESNIDNSNLMGIVKTYLDQANREVIGTTGTAKAQAINTAVIAMVQAFENAGIDMTGVTTAQFAGIIDSLVGNSGVYILDKNGLYWTAADWGTTTEHADAVGVAIKTTNGTIVVSHKVLPECSDVNEIMQWGTFQFDVQPTSVFSSINAEPFSGLMDTIHELCFANPNILIANANQWTMQGSSVMTKEQVKVKELIYFTSPSDYNDILIPWATAQGLPAMLEIGATKTFAIPNDAQATSYKIYYFSGTTSIAFTQRTATSPMTDRYGQIGCNPARRCYLYKAYTGDTHQWYTPSVYEIFMIYLNIDAVNICLTTLETGQIPRDGTYTWSCIQNGSLNAYYINMLSGSFINYGKNYTCRVRAVTRV